jgi:EAL domain-containing protein (putative c-di-GMP-specific phosphodiesterase class I)
MIQFKYLLYSILVFIIILIASFLVYFSTIKDNILKNYEINNELLINNFEDKVHHLILDNQYIKINKLLVELGKNNVFNTIEIVYTQYYISKESILSSSDNIVYKDYTISDASIDAKYGELKQINDTTFQFLPNTDYEFETDIEIKYQAMNSKNVLNSLAVIDLTLPFYELKEEKIIHNRLQDFINLENKTVIQDLFIENTINFAQITYVINYNQVYEKIKFFLIDMLTFLSMMIGFLFIMNIIAHYYIQKTTLISYIHKLNDFTTRILTNKFDKLDEKQFSNKNVLELVVNVKSVSKKMASIINELNVNKGMLELQISSDNLTKLPNIKIFEQDMKSLFIRHVPSYITLLRIECLREYSQKNSQLKTDSFIKKFALKTREVIKNNIKQGASVYRFHGGEFAIITKKVSYSDLCTFNELLVSKLLSLDKTIDSKVVHITSIPFDHYSTTENLLFSAEKIFDKTSKLVKESSFHVENTNELDEKDRELETLVTSIIKNNSFTLNYIFDTFLIDNDSKLIMQEISPNLMDINGDIIAIGTFITVAEHKGIAVDFDRQVIIQAFKYIRKNNIRHNLVVNISISSLQDETFVTWLESQFLYEYKDVVNRLIISVTTFAVKNNYEYFVKFCNEIQKFQGRILLKRFSYNDLKLEQLEELNLDYIRIHKDYTTNIDTQKKRILTNVVNFAAIHNIHIIGDTVKSDVDYKIIESLRLHSTSR